MQEKLENRSASVWVSVGQAFLSDRQECPSYQDDFPKLVTTRRIGSLIKHQRNESATIILYLDVMQDAIVIDTHLTISRAELEFKFSRGGGPGGQNVNKVETRVELLFDVLQSKSLTEEQRGKIAKHLHSRITADGILHIIAGESRSQWDNREIAVDRFTELIRKALKPAKKRKKTRVPKESKERRLEAKKRRGDIKRLRRGV